MNKEEKLLNEFIEIEKEKHRAGSGDDEFYTNQIEAYINKQRKLWIDFIKFIEEKQK